MDDKLRNFDGFVARSGAFDDFDVSFANFEMLGEKFDCRLVGLAIMGLFAGANNKLVGCRLDDFVFETARLDGNLINHSKIIACLENRLSHKPCYNIPWRRQYLP